MTLPGRVDPLRPALERLLVAYDGGPGSHQAARWALSRAAIRLGLRLARMWPNDVDVVHVLRQGPYAISRPIGAEHVHLREFVNAQPAIQSVTLSGDPADAILDHARAVAANIIVIGTRGSRSGLRRGVHHEVAAQATASVLVARGP